MRRAIASSARPTVLALVLFLTAAAGLPRDRVLGVVLIVAAVWLLLILLDVRDQGRRR